MSSAFWIIVDAACSFSVGCIAGKIVLDRLFRRIDPPALSEPSPADVLPGHATEPETVESYRRAARTPFTRRTIVCAKGGIVEKHTTNEDGNEIVDYYYDGCARVVGECLIEADRAACRGEAYEVTLLPKDEESR